MQQITELAIKGDEALAAFRPVEETPEWATFDEDIEPEPGNDEAAPDPWTVEHYALEAENRAHASEATSRPPTRLVHSSERASTE